MSIQKYPGWRYNRKGEGMLIDGPGGEKHAKAQGFTAESPEGPFDDDEPEAEPEEIPELAVDESPADELPAAEEAPPASAPAKKRTPKPRAARKK